MYQSFSINFTVNNPKRSTMNKRMALYVLLSSLLILSPGGIRAQEEVPAEEFQAGVDGTNNLVAPSETPVPEPTPEPDHVDTNTVVIEPDPLKAGKIELEKLSDNSQVIVKDAGLLVERIQLTDNELGCFIGTGQIADIKFCSGDDALLDLEGRATYKCPFMSGTTWGPCSVSDSE